MSKPVNDLDCIATGVTGNELDWEGKDWDWGMSPLSNGGLRGSPEPLFSCLLDMITCPAYYRSTMNERALSALHTGVLGGSERSYSLGCL